MTTQQKINQILKSGIKKTETFNNISVLEIEAKINITESLEFVNFLSSICLSKGRTQGTIADKSLTKISDWYQTNNGDLTISHIYGKNIYNKTSYYTITWNKEL